VVCAGSRCLSSAVAVSPPDGQTFRIMISTDNHLGYLETDPIRGDDSFVSFREMLQHARANQVDFVLLGGDLFHDNKPSRQTLCRTVNILRQFAFGENPITFEIISDQAKNFPTTKTVNYEDPNFNVALPVFSIHGNHDDPSGAGAYSTMDLLHSCSLLNYFGKIDRVDQIVNYPILMTKGDSKLALYGMGSVRDERLHRTFEADGVQWAKPQQEPAGWFNLAVVHQNRTRHTQTQRDYLPEKFLPSWLDMVIWGHEHECCADPVESVEGQYFVLQPGSSVATSLSGGESVEKKVVIMEIQRDQYRTVPVPLYTTRPFVMADVKLADELDPLDAVTPQHIEDFLTERLFQLIANAKRDPRYRNPDRPELPLVRLRVDHTGFPRISNINKFGQKFVGKVANPEELLLFSKQKAQATKGGKNVVSKSDEKQLDAFLHADRGDKIPPIHELVRLLIRQQGTLNVLTESKMAEFVDDYVNRKDLDSIADGVAKSIKQMAGSMKAEPTLADSDDIKLDDVDRLIRKKHTELTAADRKDEAKHAEDAKNLAEMFGIDLDLNAPESMRQGDEDDMADAAAAAHSDDDAASTASGSTKKKKPASRSRAKPAAAAASNGRKPAAASKAKGAAAGRGKKKAKKEESDEEDEDDDAMKEDIEGSEDEEEEYVGRRSAAKKKPAATASRRKKVIADDEDEDDAYVPAADAGDDGDERPSKRARNVPPKPSASVRMTGPPAVKASPSKKRPRPGATLSFTSTPVTNPLPPARKATAAAAAAAAAGSDADFIDLSQMDDDVSHRRAPLPPMRKSPAAAAPAAAAAADAEMDGDDDELQEISTSNWGALPVQRR